jgi:hypothetical protein
MGSLPKFVGAAALLVLVGQMLSATMQDPPQRPDRLPASIALSEVEIRLDRDTGGGCSGRCIRYRITVRGDGTVTYEDLALPPLPSRGRTVPVDDVVTLVNEFLRASFFDASDRYAGKSFYVREGNDLLLHGMSGGSDWPSWDLRLRVGQAVKSVHLYFDYPDDLGRLRDRVERLGGPQVWIAK